MVVRSTGIVCVGYALVFRRSFVLTFSGICFCFSSIGGDAVFRGGWILRGEAVFFDRGFVDFLGSF